MIHQSTYLGKYTCSQGGRLGTSHVLEPYLGSSYLPTLPVYLPPVSQSATLQSAYAGLEKKKRNSNAAQHSTAQSEENRMQWRILFFFSPFGKRKPRKQGPRFLPALHKRGLVHTQTTPTLGHGAYAKRIKKCDVFLFFCYSDYLTAGSIR